MFEGNTTDRPGIGESYSSAVNGSSLRVGNDHTVRTAGDQIAAAGMNVHRTGLALMRLVTEWESGATPPAAEPPSAKELRQQGVEPAIVDAERRRRSAQCTRWNLQENMLRFQRLKTLPAIRAGLLFYVQERDWEDAEHLVAAVLKHFLSPTCTTCAGRKKQVIPGTGHLGKRDCGECKGSGVAKVPYGYKGQRLLEHLAACTGQAAQDLSEGTRSLRRSDVNLQARAKHRGEASQAQQRRVDAEVEADSKVDQAAVAARFRDSMVKTTR